MTEITNINNAPMARDIDTITAEINAIRGFAQAVALSSAVEIGRRLKEAKELLPHGEWGTWLKEKVDFSQVTASRYMKLFEEYADKQGSLFGAEVNLSTLKNLSVSNALRLLAVPEEEREDFAAEHNVENLSAREMDKLIKEREELEDRIKGLRERQDEDADTIAELEKQIRELEARPVDVAVQEPDPAEIQKRIDDAVDKAVKEAKAAAAEDKKKLKDKLAAAEKQRNDLEVSLENAKKQAVDAGEALEKAKAEGVSPEEKERLEREIAELKKQIAMSDAAVVTFNTLLVQAQDIMNRLTGAIAMSDAETGAKLRAAFRKLLEIYGEKVT